MSRLKNKITNNNNGLSGFTLTNNNEVICANCGSNKTNINVRNGRGSPVWRNYNGKKVCQSCYNKLVVAPKYRKKLNEKQKDYRLDYCGINLFLSFKLPREKCEICGVTRKDKIIHRHHYFYCVIMPWACTISICNKCHQNITHEGKIMVKSTTRTCLICNKTDDYKKIPLKYENGYICNSCYIGRRNKLKKSKYKYGA